VYELDVGRGGRKTSDGVRKRTSESAPAKESRTIPGQLATDHVNIGLFGLGLRLGGTDGLKDASSEQQKVLYIDKYTRYIISRAADVGRKKEEIS